MPIRLNKKQLDAVLAKGHCRLTVSVFSKTHKRIPARKTNTRNMPQDILWAAVSSKWGGRAQAEYLAIEGRRFRIDIAFPEEKVAVECDGWQYHAKYKEDFKKGLKRQNLLTEQGWKFLRFTSGEIHNELEQCIAMIERAVS